MPMPAKGPGSGGEMSSHQLDRVDERSVDLRRLVSPKKKEKSVHYPSDKKGNAIELKPPRKHTQCTNTKSCIKSASRMRRKKDKRVSFDGREEVIEQHANGSSSSKRWYTASEVEQFSKDAIARAAVVELTMNYLSAFESVNPSTGLTSPRTLHEYLSNPSDVVGVECLLSSQKATRDGLKARHGKILLEDNDRGSNPEQLALRLGDTSAIAANMARKRAQYVRLLVE